MAARPAARPPASCVNLAETVELLHTHLTAALCHRVFQRVRNRERQRRWTLAALAQFWLTVILTAPRSLTQALQEGGMTFPALGAAARTSPEAFFQRAERLRPTLVPPIPTSASGAQASTVSIRAPQIRPVPVVLTRTEPVI